MLCLQVIEVGGVYALIHAARIHDEAIRVSLAGPMCIIPHFTSLSRLHLSYDLFYST